MTRTVEQIILEIERRLMQIASTPSHRWDDEDVGKERALDDLLDWIKSEDKNGGEE